MKIRAERKPLADTLAWVAQAIPKRPQAPVLSGMRLTAADGRLVMNAFDYDSSHTASVEVDVKLEGECLVSGAFLSQMVGAIKGDVVELVLDGGRLTITADRSTYKGQVMRIQDYPTLPEFPKSVGVADADDLRDLVATVAAPIDDDSPFDQVKGLHFEGTKRELLAVGANQQCLHTSSIDWSCEIPFDVTLPCRSVLGSLKGMSGEVEIGHEGGLLGLSSGDRTVTMRTYSNPFVPWGKLVREPDDDAFSLEISGAELLGAVKRAAMVDDDERLGLFVRDDELEIAGRGTQGSGEGMEILEIECAGAVGMGMNPRYLIDALAAVPHGDVRIGFVTKGKPLMIRPLEYPRMTFVVMPAPLPGGME